MRALALRQVELRRNEEALARAMDRSNAVAEKRSRLYADVGKLTVSGELPPRRRQWPSRQRRKSRTPSATWP